MFYWMPFYNMLVDCILQSNKVPKGTLMFERLWDFFLIQKYVLVKSLKIFNLVSNFEIIGQKFSISSQGSQFGGQNLILVFRHATERWLFSISSRPPMDAILKSKGTRKHIFKDWKTHFKAGSKAGRNVQSDTHCICLILELDLELLNQWLATVNRVARNIMCEKHIKSVISYSRVWKKAWHKI